MHCPIHPRCHLCREHRCEIEFVQLIQANVPNYQGECISLPKVDNLDLVRFETFGEHTLLDQSKMDFCRSLQTRILIWVSELDTFMPRTSQIVLIGFS